MTVAHVPCPACTRGSSSPYTEVDGYTFFACGSCGSLHIDPRVLASMDAGEEPLGRYADDYWQREQAAAMERAQGLSLCRAGEAILYCRRPVEKFLDIGTGPGYLLARLQELLGPAGDRIHGVEKFPPEYAVRCPNYHVGDVADLDGVFDAGVCIEVVEHLTPRMLAGLARGLRKISRENSLWLFNTGMPEYVRNQDLSYLDPLGRGHVVSYSIGALETIFGPFGFTVTALPGKSYAFIVELGPSALPDFNERIYRPLPENRELLARDGLLHQATLESARASYYYGGYLERTTWAVSLKDRVDALEQELAALAAHTIAQDASGAQVSGPPGAGGT